MPALARALQQAALTRLQVLQLYHARATQQVQQILSTLATHCPSLQQLVIVEWIPPELASPPSESFPSKL